MLSLYVALRRARRPQRGASLVEYTLLVGLIAMVCLAALMLFGGNTHALVQSSANSL